MRVSQGLWQTRLGSALWQVLPGSGNVRFLDNLYMSSGARTRLAARGNGAAAQLYELKEGTDTAFVTASGGAGLGGSTFTAFQGATLGDKFYLTDRANSLFKYSPTPTGGGNHLQSVALPTAPAAAPVATPRWYAKIEDWTSPSWIDSSGAHFQDTTLAANTTPPDSSTGRLLKVFDPPATGQTITYPSAPIPLNSHTIALYVNQDVFKMQIALQFGLGSATDFQYVLQDAAIQNTGQWYPVYVPVGDLASLNYLRFCCVQVASGGFGNLSVSTLYLPGRLEGPYRWLYTYYDPVTQRESAPSPISNGGQALDFSAVGVSFQSSTTRAFQKACALRFTASADPSVTQIRIYRSGGVPELTVDESGTDLWLRVATVNQFSTTISAVGGDPANSSTLDLTSTTGINVGDWLVIEPGVVGKEEYVQVTGKAAGFVNITNGGGTVLRTQYSHAQNAVVAVAYVDNVPNEQIDLTHTVDVERGNPPAAARFVARSPEGRLWLFNYSGAPTGIAVSNKPTPDRPFDYEVFPSGVDPITRRSLTQGFQVQYTGDISQDEEIVWGGFYRGHPYFLTRLGLYVIRHQAQVDWSATSIQLVHRTGCIAGDTVAEVQGVLYWVADGPRLVAWDGSAQEPVVLSDRTANLRLVAAPQSSWPNWFARGHTKVDGPYYQLYFQPAGASGNTQRLDYNVNRGAFEPVVYYDMNGAAIAFQAAAVRGGNVDSPDLYQAAGNGQIIQCETGLTDQGNGIKITFATAKIAMRKTHPFWYSLLETGYIHRLFLRLAGVPSDTITVTLNSGGGEYGVTTHSYALSLAGSGDEEVYLRAERDLKGHWAQVQISGTVFNRPAFRDVDLWYLVDRAVRVAA